MKHKLLFLLLIFPYIVIGCLGRGRVFVIGSSSMLPSLSKYDVAVVVKSDTYSVGDIVTYKKGETFKTHRIVTYYNGLYKTKGDANNKEDPLKVDPHEIYGKVVFVLKQKHYVFILIVLLLLLLRQMLVQFHRQL